MHLSNRRKAVSEGFTLIELMIVVAIIGILAAIAIPNFIANRNAAANGSKISDGSGVAKQCSVFLATGVGTQPTQSSGNATDGTVKVTCSSNPGNVEVTFGTGITSPGVRCLTATTASTHTRAVFTINTTLTSGDQISCVTS